MTIDKSIRVLAPKAAKASRIRVGFSLFKDGRVPLHIKVLALTLGACLTAILVVFEFPFEGIVSLLFPFLGVPFDFAVDGLEIVFLPILVAILILPSLTRLGRHQESHKR